MIKLLVITDKRCRHRSNYTRQMRNDRTGESCSTFPCMDRSLQNTFYRIDGPFCITFWAARTASCICIHDGRDHAEYGSSSCSCDRSPGVERHTASCNGLQRDLLHSWSRPSVGKMVKRSVSVRGKWQSLDRRNTRASPYARICILDSFWRSIFRRVRNTSFCRRVLLYRGSCCKVQGIWIHLLIGCNSSRSCADSWIRLSPLWRCKKRLASSGSTRFLSVNDNWI